MLSMKPEQEKFIIFGALFVPLAYIYFEMTWSILWLAGVAAWAAYTLDKSFVHKRIAMKKANPDLGQPEEPFMPPNMDYEFGEDGVPRPKMRPPR